MTRSMNRRNVIVAAAGATALGMSGGSVRAESEEASVRGSWRITPMLPEGAPPFVALAAFGAGGIFVTTGSDEPGTGIGSWSSVGADGFSFAYTNFHFDGAGSLSSVVDVQASGTFAGDELSGNAHLVRTDPSGDPIGEPQDAEFTGRRIAG